MKLTIDTTGGDEADELQARAYLASVVGPRRRPYGRANVALATVANTFESLATNNTQGRVLFVHVSVLTSLGAAILLYARDQGGGNTNFTRSETNVSEGEFILYPGESLYGAVAAGTAAFNVFTSPF